MAAESFEARNSGATAESEGEEKNAERRSALEKRGQRGAMRVDDSGDITEEAVKQERMSGGEGGAKTCGGQAAGPLQGRAIAAAALRLVR